MNILATALQDYLRVRRSLGFKLMWNGLVNGAVRGLRAPF